jgi:hypothetical protein
VAAQQRMTKGPRAAFTRRHCLQPLEELGLLGLRGVVQLLKPFHQQKHGQRFGRNHEQLGQHGQRGANGRAVLVVEPVPRVALLPMDSDTSSKLSTGLSKFINTNVL